MVTLAPYLETGSPRGGGTRAGRHNRSDKSTARKRGGEGSDELENEVEEGQSLISRVLWRLMRLELCRHHTACAAGYRPKQKEAGGPLDGGDCV